jgi:hypothetical protein
LNRRWLDYTSVPAERVLDWGSKASIHPDDLGILNTFREALSRQQPLEVEAALILFADLQW